MLDASSKGSPYVTPEDERRKRLDAKACGKLALEINSRVDVRQKVRWQKVSDCKICRSDVEEWIQKNAREAQILRHLASYAALHTSYSVDLICFSLDEIAHRKFVMNREANLSLTAGNMHESVHPGGESSTCSANAWQLCMESSGQERMQQQETKGGNYQDDVYLGKKTLLSDLSIYYKKVAHQFAKIMGGDALTEHRHVLEEMLEHGESPKVVHTFLLQNFPGLVNNTAQARERAMQYVQEVFQKVLLRDADPDALEVYSELLVQGAHERELEFILKRSEEFRLLCMAGNAVTCDEAIQTVAFQYHNVLERPPDPKGLSRYAREVVMGYLTADSIRSDLENSPEFQAGPGMLRRVSMIARNISEQHEHCLKTCCPPSSSSSASTSLRKSCSKKCRHLKGLSGDSCSLQSKDLIIWVESVLWGKHPLVDFFRTNLGSLKKYRISTSLVVEKFIEVLGRYPDTPAMLNLIPKVASGEMNITHLVKTLESSEERTQKWLVSRQPKRLGELINKAEMLAELLLENGIELGDMSPCFITSEDETEDKKVTMNVASTKTFCRKVGEVLESLQTTWNSKSPVLGKKTAPESEPLSPIAILLQEDDKELWKMVESLSNVAGIQNSMLVVFSLANFSRDSLNKIKGIDFARTRILFLPTRPDLIQLDASVAEKLHWSWLQEMMFRNIEETKSWTGDVVTIFGVKALTSDFLRILEAARAFQMNFCPLCWSIAMDSTCEESQSSDEEDNLICVNKGKLGRTIAFNSSMYDSISKEKFELIPTSWNFSLYYLMQTDKLSSLSIGPAVPRAHDISCLKGIQDYLELHLQYFKLGFHKSRFDANALWMEETKEEPGQQLAKNSLFLPGLGFVSLT